MSQNIPLDATTAIPHISCVTRRVEARAARTPEAIAIHHDAVQLSYGELNRQANQLAHHLHAAGLGAEARVGVLLERSPRLPVALLGILKAGAAYVPLDPRAPRAHRDFVCRDAGVSLVLTEPALRAHLPAEARVLDLVEEAERLARRPGTDLETAPDLEALAYVVYTSGSTGTPKGVCIPHRGLAHHGRAVLERYALAPGDRVPQFAAIGFDVAAEELFPTLCAGAALVLGPAEPPASFASFSAWVAERGVSVLNLPASFWHGWVEELERAPVPSSVRLVIVGSEAVLRTAWERWAARVGPRVRWVDAYGPSEATITATLFEPPPGGELPGGTTHTVPIGQPLAHVRALVLGAGLQPVAEGEPGTLYLGGPGLARGYQGRPALTAERFVPDPFATEPGARLYDTGDRVRRLADGSLEFLGRNDRQVKVRGHRIEPGEVEQVLTGHPAVRQAVVTPREAAPGDARLVAYVVASAGAAVEPAVLRAFLAERLPPYMVPSAFVALEALPRTPAGKVAYADLPAPDLSRAEHVPPRTDTERTLAAIFEDVLGVTPVGASDGFFELGGHSLGAMRVTARIRERLQVELPIRTLLEAQTVEALALAVDALPRTAAASASIELLPRPEHLPLSYPQEQVWMVQQLEPNAVAYTAPTLIHLEGRLDVEALQRAIDELSRRHEVLRTSFPSVEGRPVQRIHPPEPVPLPLSDLSALPEGERAAAMERGLTEELRTPFAMDRLPLLRWRLFRLEPERHALAVVEHHLVHDGWSTNVLFQELFALYAAYAAHQPSPLPPPSLQFADFVVWHRRWLEGEEATRQLRYWTERLAGVPERIHLPTDRPRPAVQRFRGAALRMHLPERLERTLRERCRQEGFTPYVALLAAYATLLHRYSRQADFCIGSGIANRRWRETEGMLGMLINTITLRVDVADDPPFRALLHRLRERTLEAAAHQDVPFERIVEALRPERDPGRNPLFQVMFGLHDAPLAPQEVPDLRWSLLESPPNGSAKFDLGLIAIPRPETAQGWSPSLGGSGFTLIWEFNTDLFDADTIRRMQERFLRLLEAGLTEPERRLSRLPLLSPEERGAVHVGLRGTRPPTPAERGVHALFAEQARRRPDAPALTHGARTLTYRELAGRAHRLAHHLRRAGVREGTVVGLHLERSVEAVVGMLGILAAGGACLPLEPSYPAERLAFMVEDASARVVLTGSALEATAFAGAARVLARDASWEGEEDAAPPAEGLSSDSPAYVIYTSGTTGRPKGVSIPHRGLVQLVVGNDFLPVGPEDRFAQVSTLAFDAATMEVWGALLNGAHLVVLDKEVALSPEELSRALREHGITTLFLTTALFHQLVAARPELFASLRTLMFGGEAADARRVREVLLHGRPQRLVNLYGPTEATCITSAYLAQQVPEEARSLPIGRPISHKRLHVLDARLEPVPPGIPGELYIGGEGLALGYVGRPELTAERFVPDAFSEKPGARLYATGDVVRELPDGSLEFLGRVDEQVKIRGFRVEPDEVRAVLARHPDVDACIVLPREDARGVRFLAAYAAARPGAERPTAQALRAWLRERLPAYLVPSAVAVLDALPLTAGGKVDRRALPAASSDEEAPLDSSAAPRTPTEEALADIWAEVLPPQRFGIHDSFFHLGGHSLGAMQVLARVRSRLGVELPVRRFFEAPTLAAVATAIVQQRAAVEEQERLTGLLSQLEHLPEDEVRRRLAGAPRPEDSR
jgi:amino acid adenylation domain-containing protein